MASRSRLKSGQLNYENPDSKGVFTCIVVRDGVFHNLSEDQRLDLIKILQAQGEKEIDLREMFE